ncbi:hypothetical protein IAD21_00689 [Abditibacteriota bacterium]|nr:hypothetical protein IAD21_00689 [Abditibacteriota bacterium]
MFIPAHNAVVLYALESGSITESTNGTTAATLPTAPTTPTVLGYTNLPQTARGLNNSKGFAIGQQGAAYNKRGRVEPSITVEIRPGSLEALSHLQPNEDGILPHLALYVVVKDPDGGSYTDTYRFCKPTTLDWKLGGGGDKGGGEISISAAFWATAYKREAVLTVAPSDLRDLGTPLMWHDVRQFTIEDATGSPTSYRRSLMNLSVKVDYGLERKNERPHWGDSEPLSRTSYALLEHHQNISGEIGLHERLPEGLFSAAAQSQDWGDIVIVCSDAHGSVAATKGFTLTLAGAFPSDETQGGGESNAEIDHTIPFTADGISVAVV